MRFCSCALLALFMFSGCGRRNKADEQVADWAEIEGYTLRPPKGYPPFDRPGIAPPGAKYFAWGGTWRKDGSAPDFLVMVGTPPPDERPSLQEALAAMLKIRQRGMRDWQQTPSEEIESNGLKFARAYWQCTEGFVGRQWHGFVYVAFDGPTFIEISCQDVEPHHIEALKVAEAAALTFKKK